MIEFDVAEPVDAQEAPLALILLHPHPDMGGDRFHPLISELHRRLPQAGYGSIRFDFSSSTPDVAQAEVQAALEFARLKWPHARQVLVGYSFGSAIACNMDDPSIGAWGLVAPVATALVASNLGQDQRPKLLIVPEDDQFSSPDAVETAIHSWRSTETVIVPGDHFLGASLDRIVELILVWVSSEEVSVNL